jgi:lipopolysaccharide transport system permease protein
MFIPLAMMFLMFSSGVFFDFRDLNNPQMMNLMLSYNPMAFLLDAYRQILMYQTLPDLLQLARIGFVFAGVTALMVGWMRKNSRLLALKALTA